MDIDDVLLDAEERMEKAVQVLGDGLRVIRTGTAGSGLVENVRVEYFGSPTPLKQLAQIAIPDPQLIVIKPYDPTTLPDIEKAIQTSDIGIHPQNDGKVIRLNVPGLSEERRRQLVARIRQMAEEARVAVRNIRRDANRHLDREEKDSAISEDDCRRAKDEVQELTGQYEQKINDLLDRKSKELMEV